MTSVSFEEKPVTVVRVMFEAERAGYPEKLAAESSLLSVYVDWVERVEVDVGAESDTYAVI